MNTNLISALPQVDMSTLATSSFGTTSGLDFSQILAGLQTQDMSAFGLTNENLLTQNLSDLLLGSMDSSDTLSSDLFASGLLGNDLMNMDILSLGALDLSFLEGLAGQILQELSQPQGEEEEESLLALIASLQTELQALNPQTQQVVLGQQLMSLLSQMSGQTPTPALQEDGSLAWSLPGSAQMLTTLSSATPQDVLQWMQAPASQNLFTQALVAASTNGASTQTTSSTQAEQPAQTSQTAPISTAAENSGQGTAPNSTTENGEGQNGLSGTALPLTQPGIVTTGNVAATTPTPAFLTQMQTGIESGLQSGLEEFQIKLSPEGLGEVLVQLKSTENGLTLTLIAQNAETQRLLAADLEQLRSSLSPLKVEVQEVLNGQESEFLNEQQQQEGQRHLHWQQAQAQQNLVRRSIHGESQTLQEAQNLSPEQPSSILDTYI